MSCTYAPSCLPVRAKAQNLHFTRQMFVWFRYRLLTKKTSSVPPRRRRAVSARRPTVRMSSLSRIATPSSRSSRSPASTFSSTAASALVRSIVAISRVVLRGSLGAGYESRSMARWSSARSAGASQPGARSSSASARRA